MSKLFPFIRTRSLIGSLQIRNFPRWEHRRPVRVFQNEEEAERGHQSPVAKLLKDERDDLERENLERDDALSPKYQINWKRPDLKMKEPHSKINYKGNASPLTISSKIEKPRKQQPAVDMLQTVIDSDGNFVYTKMANNDPRVGHILTEIKSKKVQETNKVILLEGKRLIKDALQANVKLEYLLFSRMDEVEYLRPHLPQLGSTLYKMPYREMQMWSDLTTNPGIMGVFKKPETSTYTSPSHTLPFTVILDNVREPNNLGAILRVCSGVGCDKIILTKGCTNLWDHKVLRSACGSHFRLQIHNKLEWNEIEQILGTNCSVFVADNRGTLDPDGNVSENTEADLILNTINLLPYFSINFNSVIGGNNHIVLVIGGETQGISEECYKFCESLQGVRVNIPLENNVESLNVGTAFGIIAFEIKRQLSSSVK